MSGRRRCEHVDDAVDRDVREPRVLARGGAHDQLRDPRRRSQPEVDARILGREVAAARAHVARQPGAVGQDDRHDRAGGEARERDVDPVAARLRRLQQDELPADRVDRDLLAAVVPRVRDREPAPVELQVSEHAARVVA